MRNWLVAVLAFLVGLGAILSVKGAIVELPTSRTGLVGFFGNGPVDLPLLVDSAEFEAWFGSENPPAWPAEIQARAFFQQGGSELYIVRVAPGQPLVGDGNARTGMRAFDGIADLRILLVPELTHLSPVQFAPAMSSLRDYVDERNLFTILDPPPGLDTVEEAVAWVDGAVPDNAAGLAIYYPYLKLDIGDDGVTAGASGTMAAVYEFNDQGSGIWDAPAGPDLPLVATDLTLALSNAEIDQLNVKNINAIREFAGIGIVPWGSRTRDVQAGGGDTRFIPSSRMLRWMEASITRGLADAAGEHNDVFLWARLRTEVVNFLDGLWRDGALAGATPSAAYFVRCDQTTTTPADIAAARVFVLYGVSLIRPAEFSVTNVELATFDPFRPWPELPVLIQAFGNDLYLSYPTVPGFRYRRQMSADLSFAGSGAWVEGDGEWERERITINALREFYRIVGERVPGP